MGLTPVSTIVAAPQGTPVFDFQAAGSNQPSLIAAYSGLYLNGSDQYVVLSEADNSITQVYHLSVFKNGVAQNTAARPLIRNWDTHVPCQVCASAWGVVQVGTKLYVFYFADGSTETDSVLAFQSFDMATDLWSAPNASTLATISGALGSDSLNQFTFNAPGMSVVYDATTQFFYVIAANGHKVGTDFCRPAFARFLGGSATWDATWTDLGDLTTQEDQGCFSACLDCRGAVNCVIASTDQSSLPAPTTLYLQTIYSNQTISALQATGVAPINSSTTILETDSRILCTGTELIIIWGSDDNGVGSWRQTNCARATVPSTNVLPSAWTLEVVRASTRFRRFAYVSFFISGELYVIESLFDNFFQAGTLTASHFNGATWDNDITFAAAVTLALPNGTPPSAFSLITYDLSAPASSGADIVGYHQELYSLPIYSAPVCAAPPAVVTVTNPGQGARKPVPLPVNGFDFCLHREYRLYCSINVAMLTCGSIPACFSVDERDWGVDG